MNWQLAITWICIAFASWLVIRRVRASLRGDGSSACGGCPKSTPPSEERIITEEEISLPSNAG